MQTTTQTFRRFCPNSAAGVRTFKPTTISSVFKVPLLPSRMSIRSAQRLFSAEATKDTTLQEKSDAAAPNDEQLKIVLSEKDKQIADLQDLYRRSLADMENIRQRTKKEVENASTFAITKFAKDLLDTADVLEIALKSVPAEIRSSKVNKPLKDFYDGVSMTHDNLLKTFKRFGVEPFAETLGAKFDHNLHEAVFQAPVPNKEPGSIIEVIKPGYMIHGRVLRSAQVGVISDSN
ncbi:Mitochondrial matrix cochaperone [Physocladia obscura]|uniref:GrpE protein homolog n=1 Tax=Physocladia obscura TaxID=109957 RepID=A0AAD5SZ67_9FUNG|nr:Mitochondrial matrix cochaperone [Physocladia obscura]